MLFVFVTQLPFLILQHAEREGAIMAASKFPEVQGGGSLILAWQVRNKRVLVVGGGEVSTIYPNPENMRRDGH